MFDLRGSFQLRTFSFAVLCVALVALGCNRQNTNVAVQAPPAQHVGPPLTKDDYETFGKKLEKAIMDQDRNTVVQCYRIEQIFERSVSDFSMSQNDRRAMMQGVSKGAGALPDAILQNVKAGGSVKFLRVLEKEGKLSLILRVLIPEGGINYQELTLVRYPDQQIGAEDIYVFALGDRFSSVLRRYTLMAMAGLQKDFFGKLKDKDQIFVKHADKITDLNKATQSGDNQKARMIYNSMPQQLQYQPEILVVAMSAHENEEYIRLVERFRALYPNNPALDLILIDYYTVKKEFDKALESTDKLVKSVGGDPELNVVRAFIMVEAKKLKEAKTEFETALTTDPTLTRAYEGMLDIAIREKNHPDALKWLKKGMENNAFDPDEDFFKTNDEYKDFVKSKEFTEFVRWSKSRKK